MCGICGIVELGPAQRLEIDIERMLRAIRHRGTVDGYWIERNVAMGVRRLPIIDIEGSSQPIINEDKTLVLIGNGEIYNFRELRSQLAALGHTFTTNGDLECILHLYESYGNDCWKKLRGQFAIALYDTRRLRLTLARDQLGIIPLFYQSTKARFLFGSEIKSIAAHASFQKELNQVALADFLSLQFIPRPQTIYRDVQSLAPGSVLTLEDGTGVIHSFWSVSLATETSNRSREEISLQTRLLLNQAVSRSLTSDAPVGVLLSGGLDSSGIAALAAQITRKPFHTFAVVFKEKSFDESPYSREMARRLGSQHHEVVLDEDIILDSMSEIGECFDEPFAEGSAFPIYHICKCAKDFVTVILSGEGADEIFCGYEPYTAQQFLKYYQTIPQTVRKWLRAGINRLPVSDSKVSWDLRLRRFVEGASYEPAKAHFWWRCSMNDDEKSRVLDADFLRDLEHVATSRFYEERFASFTSDDSINRIMASDCTLHLPDDLLLRGNLLSMAHTVELRVPYLDVDLVEFAFTIPSKQKLRGFTNKIPLRDALKGFLPDGIRTRAKQGLNMPYQKWFKRPRWKQLLHDTLSKSSVDPLVIFNSEGIQSMLCEHERGAHNHAHALWVTTILILWLKGHLCGK